jgi:hypothetical protein
MCQAVHSNNQKELLDKGIQLDQDLKEIDRLCEKDFAEIAKAENRVNEARDAIRDASMYATQDTSVLEQEVETYDAAIASINQDKQAVIQKIDAGRSSLLALEVCRFLFPLTKL